MFDAALAHPRLGGILVRPAGVFLPLLAARSRQLLGLFQTLRRLGVLGLAGGERRALGFHFLLHRGDAVAIRLELRRHFALTRRQGCVLVFQLAAALAVEVDGLLQRLHTHAHLEQARLRGVRRIAPLGVGRSVAFERGVQRLPLAERAGVFHLQRRRRRGLFAQGFF